FEVVAPSHDTVGRRRESSLFRSCCDYFALAKDWLRCVGRNKPSALAATWPTALGGRVAPGPHKTARVHKSRQLEPRAAATRLPDLSYAAVARGPKAWLTDRRAGACGMTGLAARLRVMLGALVVCGLIALCTPAFAQAPLIDPDASVVNEQTLLREAPRI